MPTKSSSPEAAQNKVRKAEIKELEKARRHVIKCVDAELSEAARQCEAARKAFVKATKTVQSANRKYDRLMAKLDKSRTRDLDQIDRRIAILNGRVGAN